jgi:hypothetical protein
MLGVDGFTLPLEAVTESIGILAKRRSGKSTTARRFVEQLFYAKQHVVIIDPKGDWHGLLYARDGKRPGLPFIVLGGEHGHVKLETGAGDVVARLVVEERVNVILDLSRFRKDEIPLFVTPFLESLYRLKAQEQYRTAMMLVVDEADAIAPQKPDRKGQVSMAAALEDIVRRGGQRGIGCTMISQRSSVLSKNVLTQIGILIILRTIAPQDLRAMDDWISAHGTYAERAAVLTALPTMAPGEAFVWAPGWPDGHGIFERVQMALPDTFDSSSTPRAGQRARAPKHAAEVDLSALTSRMADTIAEAKANDPRALRDELATERTKRLELQRQHDVLVLERDQLREAAKDQAATKERRALLRERREIGWLYGSVTKRFRKVKGFATAQRQQWDLLIADLHDHVVRMEERGATLHATPATVPPPFTPTPITVTGLPPMPPGVVSQRVMVMPNGNAAESDAIGAGERNVLRAVVAAGQPVTREYLTLATGYKKSTRNAYLQRLSARGLVLVTSNDVTATAQGISAAGPVDRAPTGSALVAWWLARLPAGEATVLRLVLEGIASRDVLSERSGFKKTTRNAYLQRLAVRNLVTVDADGRVRPHEVLMG